MFFPKLWATLQVKKGAWIIRACKKQRELVYNNREEVDC